MALWQFVLDLLPASAASVDGMPAARLSREQLDAVDLDLSSGDQAALLVGLETLLPEKESWSERLRIWGDENTDDIQVFMDGEVIEAVQFRLDVSNLSLALVGGISTLARRFNCVLASRDGAIIQPTREAVIRMVLGSPAMRFVNDSRGYLEEAVRLDDSDG